MNESEIIAILELLSKFNATERREIRSLIEDNVITDDENQQQTF